MRSTKSGRVAVPAVLQKAIQKAVQKKVRTAARAPATLLKFAGTVRKYREAASSNPGL
jgi:hypothetical protein